MAIFSAITKLRHHKTTNFLCSEYSHVPHADEDEDPSPNHFLMAQKHPEVAAHHMDSYKSMLTMLYLLHKKMAGEVTHML
jgi:hypothetical protein